MRMILVLLTFASIVVPTLSFADHFKSNIHSVSLGNSGEPHLIKLDNGRVVFIKESNKSFFEASDFLPGNSVEVEVDKDSNLKAVSSIPDEAVAAEESVSSMPANKTYGTVLESYERAASIFGGMNRSWKRSTECTDRAHVWAYEEWKKHGLVSQKVFLFFTNTYIRRYRYGWWFHVSPYTLVSGGENGVTEYVMDRRYTGGPRTMKTWTDNFIYSKKFCASTTYRHYRANNNGPEHCFLVKSAMYYRLPYHVRMKEDYGQIKSSFSMSEVNFSYRAFSRRGR